MAEDLGQKPKLAIWPLYGGQTSGETLEGLGLGLHTCKMRMVIPAYLTQRVIKSKEAYKKLIELLEPAFKSGEEVYIYILDCA